MNAKVLKLRGNESLLGGELLRFRVLKGPDQGVSFAIFSLPVKIGRDEDCEIFLTDLKASRLHASVDGTDKIFEISDEESANGVELNQKKVKRNRLATGDTISLGETVFQVILSQEPGAFALVKSDLSQMRVAQNNLEEQKIRVRNLGRTAGAENLGKVFGSSTPQQSSGGPFRLIIIGLVGVFLYMTFFVEEDNANNKINGNKSQTEERKPASIIPIEASRISSFDQRKGADRFFKIGFREFREKNYLRAKNQFETALQIDPTHFLAKIYLENTKKSLEDEIADLKEKAKKNYDLGRLLEARAQYEAIQRNVQGNKTNSSYLEAETQIKSIDIELSGSDWRGG